MVLGEGLCVAGTGKLPQIAIHATLAHYRNPTALLQREYFGNESARSPFIDRRPMAKRVTQAVRLTASSLAVCGGIPLQDTTAGWGEIPACHRSCFMPQ